MGSLTVAWHVRHCQVTGLPMPNGKGGFMNFRDGYYLAVALLVMSLFWFISAYRFLRSVSAPESNGPD